MRMGNTTLVVCRPKWKRAWEWLLVGMGENDNNTFPNFPFRDIDSSLFHSHDFTGYSFRNVYGKQQQVRRDTSMGLTARGNGNDRWD